MGTNKSKLISTSSQTESSFEIPEVTFDDFQILRAIGKGSFGKVCIVQKKDTRKMYAMKYMSKALCIEKDAFQNVQKEIELLAKLEHPFIVNLWFTFQDEEDIFMVVDLLLGGDLRFHLQQERFFSEDRVALYLFEISLALDYLKFHKILHRDIKPDNILLDESGHIHITDFNIAIELNDGEEATSMSGTKPYMAPEVFQCALDLTSGYSFEADWWSLGVCVYEMLCGQRPFDIHSTTKLDQIITMQRDEVLKFPTTVSTAFVHLIQRLLSFKREERIASIADLKSRCSFCKDINFDALLEMKVQPGFIPPKNQLNCDPTFELEEMIIEANPLHKKKKRLLKQQSVKKIVFEHQNSSSLSESGGNYEETNQENVLLEFPVYNREKELQKRQIEEKEKLWEEELNKIIN